MKNLKLTLTLCATFILLAQACKKTNLDDVDDPVMDNLVIQYIDDSLREDFNAALSSLGGCTSMDQPVQEPMPNGSPSETQTQVGNQSWTCSNQPMIYGPQFSEVSIFAPSEVIWVGSFLRGDAISTGSWTPVVYDNREQYNVTISLATETGSTATQPVVEPALSSYTAAHNVLIGNIAPGTTAANMSFEKSEVHAREEVAGHIGASFGGWGSDISGTYDWSSTNSTSKYFLKLVQSYYTVAVDIPPQADDWFGSLPSYDQMASYCPVYISNISYGRVIYITVETSSSMDSLAAGINAAYSGFTVSGSFNWSCNEMASLQQLHIEGFIRGGSSDVGAELISSGNINQAIVAGAQFSSSSPGVPIAFTVRRLSDNAQVDFVTLSEYTIQECDLVGTQVTANIQNGAWRDFCPIKTHGDDDFGGNGPIVSGTISIAKSLDQKQIVAHVVVLFDETLPDMDGDDTQAQVDEGDIVLYTAPFGKRISSIEANTSYTVQYTDGPPNAHLPETVNVTSAFVEQLIINGDTEGDELPCDMTNERSYLKVRFKPFNVTLVDQ